MLFFKLFFAYQLYRNGAVIILHWLPSWLSWKMEPTPAPS